MLLSSLEAARDEWLPLAGEQRLQELADLLWRMSREPLRLPRMSMGGRVGLGRARDFLHEHLAGKVALRELAGVAGLSEFHFCKQFARRFHLPPHAYQVQLRLLAARRMLREGEPVREVARVMGFAKPSRSK